MTKLDLNSRFDSQTLALFLEMEGVSHQDIINSLDSDDPSKHDSEIQRAMTLASICTGMRDDLYGASNGENSNKAKEVVDRTEKRLNGLLKDYKDEMVRNLRRHVGDKELDSYEEENADKLMVHYIIDKFAQALSSVGIFLSTLPSNELQNKIMNVISEEYRELAQVRRDQQAENILQAN